jgi:hypothetical protein
MPASGNTGWNAERSRQAIARYDDDILMSLTLSPAQST